MTDETYMTDDIRNALTTWTRAIEWPRDGDGWPADAAESAAEAALAAREARGDGWTRRDPTSGARRAALRAWSAKWTPLLKEADEQCNAAFLAADAARRAAKRRRAPWSAVASLEQAYAAASAMRQRLRAQQNAEFSAISED